MSRATDRELGMNRSISRRDFLNGVSVALTGSLLSTREVRAFRVVQDEYYPPRRTGLRGSHPGSFEVSHDLRDGKTWEPTDLDESYDLVVVGGGISGLSAAYFFRKQAGLDARVLVLDNHDDFGGHAKRNEFWHQGRMYLMNGGTLNVEAPSQYSTVAAGLLSELGIDRARYYKSIKGVENLYHSLKLGYGMFFDKETFGEDRLVAGLGKLPMPEFLAKTPLSEPVRRDIARLHQDNQPDYLTGLSSDQKKERLARMSYRDFLLKQAHCASGVVPFFDSRPKSLFCTGIDAFPALYAWNMGFPGFQGMALEPTPTDLLINEPGGAHGRENEKRAESGDPDMYFPDGNATIARLLVRALIPEAIPGDSMEDVITVHASYDRLDRKESGVRLRLNSTVVRVEHDGPAERAKEVVVSYVSGGTACRVRGRAVVLACWNEMIPYLCGELPQEQKKALAYGVKAPLVYTSVLVSGWTSFTKLGVSSISAPGSYHTSVGLGPSLRLGDYVTSQKPEEPIVVRMSRYPCKPGLPRREQHRAGRQELLSTTFETFERNIRDQLGRTLSAGGFDPARDVVAITVNRWPHGYAYPYNTLYDPVEWALTTTEDRPAVRGRKPFGRIAIANSDAAASPHTDAAINEAYRAVQEIGTARSAG